MRRLLELLEELRSEGHRALVFSQFTSHLELVREELDRAGFTHLYLDGSTPAGMRAKRIASFQNGEGDVFLISLKAGGTGINLTAADYVIHLDPWWNPAVEDQATDRAHRIGQTKPVTVYRLIARGTIEEQILSLHSDKRALVAGVLEGTDVAARLTTKDLLALLAGGDGPREQADEEETPRTRTVH
jgi:SNF2 family DNA or RNA helicase